MAAVPEKINLLNLPPEIRNIIYAHLFPVPHGSEDDANPIISRRLAFINKNYRGFFCYQCSGEVLMLVCRQTRHEVLPFYFKTHEVRFQLWIDHRAALEGWFNAVSEDAINQVRRFRLHTQFLGEGQDTARSPGFPAAAMPGYIKVDLDAEADAGMVAVSQTWTKDLLSTPSREVFKIAMALPLMDRKRMLTKAGLLRMVDAVGWFGFRNAREREYVLEQSQARASFA